MLILKQGVRLVGLTPQILVAVIVANEVYGEYRLECVITSGSDGKHGVNSLHNKDGICNAVDCRTRHILVETNKKEIRDKIKERLGENYDVVLEKDHIHIEYDPEHTLVG